MLALLHTSAVHVPVFDALRDRDHPGLRMRHLVSDELLADARTAGPGAVAGRVRRVLAGAVADSATAVLCTCSTIGGVAEPESVGPGVPVLRVDRPMAVAAVASGSRIAVIAAPESTLEPTVELIREEGPQPDVRPLLAEGAWELFEAGGRGGYLDAVARVVRRVTDAEEIVPAQASMADAADRVRSAVPVLSSPRLGLAAASALV